jgi:hypothetical protein
LNIPFVSWLTDAPVPVSDYHDANADIDLQVRNHSRDGVRRLAISSKVVSADGQFSLSTQLNITGDLPFAPFSADFKAARILLFARRIDGVIDRFWCSPSRETAFFKNGSDQLAEVAVDAGDDNRLCLNQLSGSTDKPVCINLLTDDSGNIRISDVRISRYAGIKCEFEPGGG